MPRVTEPDDRVLRPTWWVALLVTPVLTAAGVILYGFPLDTERLWAWPMGPAMTSLAVGGGYLAGALLFLRSLWQHEWHRIGLVFAVATVLTVLLLAATLLHWELFSHGHVSFWAWLVVYLVTPVLLPAIWLHNRRHDPGTAPPDTALVPRPLGLLVGTVGAVQMVIALAFYVRPSLAIDLWPWEVTPLTTRTLSAFLAFIGAMWLVFWFERRWSALQLHVESAALGLALVGLGALRASDDLAGGATSVIFVVLLGGMVVGSVVLAVKMRRVEPERITA